MENGKYDPYRYDTVTPNEAKEILKKFDWNYVVLADENQDDELYKINRDALDLQKEMLKQIANMG
jgi:hypothetical protein